MINTNSDAEIALTNEETMEALREIEAIVLSGRLYTPLEAIGVKVLSAMGYDSGSLSDFLEEDNG